MKAESHGNLMEFMIFMGKSMGKSVVNMG